MSAAPVNPVFAQGRRELWLRELTERVRPWFAEAKAPLPLHVQVSCGWPSRGATSSKKRVIGQCFKTECSAILQNEVFITPTLADSQEVAAVLIHELVHAADDCEHKHGKEFGKIARALGLEGIYTATHGGGGLIDRLEPVIAELGPYPHGALNPTLQIRKQSTRMKKAECPKCGYVIRTTQKWIEAGLPTCCCGTQMEVVAA